jgi:serine/threonine protein kinase
MVLLWCSLLQVKLGRDVNEGSQVAVKLLFEHRMTPGLRRQLDSEVHALSTVSHNNILQLLDKYDAVNYPNRKRPQVKREVSTHTCCSSVDTKQLLTAQKWCAVYTYACRLQHWCLSWLLLANCLTSSCTLAD